MREETVTSWDDFERMLCQIQSLRQKSQKRLPVRVSNLFYRGQADCHWHLETTLERSVSKPVSLNAYYRLIEQAKARIQTFTGKSWEIPTFEEYLEWLQPGPVFPLPVDVYEYFIYLRHHGFPSPLLDWTTSPYVAAFFAMRNLSRKVEMVSVYAFLKEAGQGTMLDSGQPVIYEFDPNIAAHRRHFLQQSSYTICAVAAGKSSVYTKHENAFGNSFGVQDLLWKINIPISIRIEFLARLHEKDINSFSLFETEDSLLETLATDVFVLNRTDMTTRVISSSSIGKPGSVLDLAFSRC